MINFFYVTGCWRKAKNLLLIIFVNLAPADLS